MKKKVLFSVHVGDSVAHVLRTRTIAKYLASRGYAITYSVPRKAIPFLKGFLDSTQVFVNDQDYSYSKFSTFEKDHITGMYYEHAASEAELYEHWKPDVIIGDTGLLAYAYNPQVAFLKIINRFYIELDDYKLDSPYSYRERELICKQVEDIVNETRKMLGIFEHFHYHDFAKPLALVNGASYFVEDIRANYKFVGIHTALKQQKRVRANPKRCFVTFGTGLAEHQVETASKVLRFIEPRFEKIYVSYGTEISRRLIYQPANAIMLPLFDEFPNDVGVLVCHGGYGIIHQGIASGIPIIAIPWQIEHYSNSYRMEKLGAGVNVGIYDKEKFRGLYESIQIDWDGLHIALDNMEDIRRASTILNDLESFTPLYAYVERFIEKL